MKFNSILAILAIVAFDHSMVLAHEKNEAAEAQMQAEIFEKSKFEQKEYFDQLRSDIESGRPVDIASGQCKYISSIFRPPIPKAITLTFDDGPSKYTATVLDLLKKYDIRGTFFLKGENAKANSRMLKRMYNEGHIVANHSYSHPNFHELSSGEQASEFYTTDEVISPYMPPNFKIFRYPYGNSTCATNALVKKAGYSGILGWHIDSCDWAFANHGNVSKNQARICEVAPENVANFVGHVMTEVKRHNGGVLLLHDIHERTVASLEEIIIRLTRAGYTFLSTDDPKMAEYLK